MATKTATTHTFYIGQNDRLPNIIEQALQSNGVPLDLTSASSVKFYMWKNDSGVWTPKVNGVTGIIVPGDLTQGWLEYDWAIGDTDTVGEFFRRWIVMFNLKPVSVPNYQVGGYPVMVS